MGGLRGRLGLQLSRTGGALAKGQNKVTGSIERDPTKQETKAAKKIQDAFKKKESSILQQSSLSGFSPSAFNPLSLSSRASSISGSYISGPPLGDFDFNLSGDVGFDDFSIATTMLSPAGTGAGLSSPSLISDKSGGAYAMPGKCTEKRVTATATALLRPHSDVHAPALPTATATDLEHHKPGALKTPNQPGGKSRGGKFGEKIYDSIRQSLPMTKGNTVSPCARKGPPVRARVVPAGEEATPKTKRLNRKLKRDKK